MASQGRGTIVNIAPRLGFGNPFSSIYMSSKNAVAALTQCLAVEMAATGVRVNAVAPGPIETPLLAQAAGGDPNIYASVVPMQRIGRPEEVAEAVVWLLSGAASYVTGHAMPVDGGYVAR